MTKTIFAAALAAALAMPTAAQVETESGRAARERIRRSAGQTGVRPAPAPAQAQGQAAPGQAAQGQPLTEEQRSAFAAIHAYGQIGAQAAEMATTRGSQEVQRIGRKMLEEHRHAVARLTELVKARGADVSALGAPGDRQKLEGEVAQLNTKTGPEFDTAFVDFITRNGVGFVDALKRARDVTPGKDPELKKFLDDVENWEEEHLTSARQLKSQRQARTPPQR